MNGFCFPENCKVVNGFTALGIGTAGAVYGVAISLKNVQRMYAVINYRQGDATQVIFGAQKGTAVAMGDAEAITQLMPIWADEATAASDLLVRQADAATFQVSAVAGTKLIIFELDPDAVGTVAAGTRADCVRFYPSSANIPVTSAWAMTYVLEPRYPSAVISSPTVVLD
jgi:hypothetical protein